MKKKTTASSALSKSATRDLSDVYNCPYTEAQWDIIVDKLGMMDEFLEIQIKSAAFVGYMSELNRQGEPEPARQIKEFIDLSVRLNSIAKIMENDRICMGIMVAAGGDDAAHHEIKHFRASARRVADYSLSCSNSLKSTFSRIDRHPREKEVLSRNYSLNEWAAIYENVHGSARASWNDVESRASGNAVEFLMACASPIFDPILRRAITPDAIRDFLRHHYVRSRAMASKFPTGFAIDEDGD